MSHRFCRSCFSMTALLFVSACAGIPWGGGERAPEGAARYFGSPEEAVERVSRLLDERDWTRLSAYYDLEASGERRSSLRDGSFFMRPAPLEGGNARPARRWHPFHPGSEFSHVNPTAKDDVVEVVVEYETEAEGGLRLRGYDSFRMRRSPQGWRILPE